jgi:hypothetical protein
MQFALSQSTPSRQRGRMAAVCCAAAILVTAWNGISATAFAQSASLPQATGQGRISAPIGHRQPRAQDLPPDVLRDEGMTPFVDENLRICRQC